VCVSRSQSVCLLSVGPESVLWQNDWIGIPFGMVSGVGQGTGVLDGVVIIQGEGAVLEVNLGCPIITNGDFVA